MNAEKTALRKQFYEKIKNLPEDYIALSDKGIFENLIKLPEFEKAATIFTYFSMNREPDTRRIVEYALSKNKTVALPVCAKCGVMDARAITSTSELSLSSYQLLEPLSSTRVVPPEAFDFIIVPALAYDKDGYRLGYGGGYYDRYLLKATAFTVGITRALLMCDMLPRETHDIPVHCVITEKEARLLKGASR